MADNSRLVLEKTDRGILLREYYAPTNNWSVRARFRAEKMGDSDLQVLYATGDTLDGEMTYPFYRPLFIAPETQMTEERILREAREYAIRSAAASPLPY